jgi:hypothetical protein
MFLLRFLRRSAKQTSAQPPEPDPPEPDPQWCLQQVVDSLRLAALPAEEQIAALPDFVHVPAEVALLYDDAFRLVPQIRDAGLITNEQQESLVRINRLHGDMGTATDKDWLWTVDAMRSDERWARSRRLAVEALAALGREAGTPRFEGTTWVSASETGTGESPG